MQRSLRLPSIVSAASLVMLLGALPTLAQPSFLTFESGQVRPLALSPDGTRLFAANTPDGRLEIFEITAAGLTHEASVPVGLEPVAVASRNDDEVWVVNLLSDSVSIVDTSAVPPRVVRTLLVGDEPRDIVFAGAGGNRAFVTTAHRGQQRTDPSLSGVPGAGDPQLIDPGAGRADVWVFDAGNLGNSVGGTPLRIVQLFGDTPRPLAVSNDGQTVYAGIFYSGNQTTTVTAGVVCPGFDPGTPCTVHGTTYPGGNPGPATNHEGAAAPHTGLVVQLNNSTGKWEDELGRDWSDAVRFDLPDRDVFAIDAATLQQTAIFTHVGTTLFNIAVNPQSGVLYVSNTESFNQVRFEGPGDFGGSTVQGHLAETRITVIDGSQVKPRHLNKHIDYSILPAPAGTKEHSLSTPLQMQVSSDGATLYVAAFGSGKVGVFDTSALENDTFDPTITSANYIPVSGGGPSGLALDETRNRLYVLTRFDNAISVVDLGSGGESVHLAMHNPEPPSVVAGRPFLYDAQATSSNGEASCASCHIFGDFDQLAWDLGDPDADVKPNPIPINLEIAAAGGGAGQPINGTGQADIFHPMKGPMTTQTLRGLRNSGAMHWRGDRSDGFFGIDPFDEELSFKNFIVAFQGLVGRETIIAPADMQKFSDFMLQVALPPNPVRKLDNSLTAAQSRGRNFFLGCDGLNSVLAIPFGCGHRADGVPFVPNLGFTCEGCHTLDASQGSFGTGRLASFEDLPQIVKIPHLRNLYAKAGMFGNPAIDEVNEGNNGDQGEQIRGFGYLHDGSVDSVFRFVNGAVFNNAFFGLVGFAGGDPQRRDVEQFMLAFDSDLPPIVGQQVTLSAQNATAVNPRIDLLIQRARSSFTSKVLGGSARECDLVVQGTIGGVAKGWKYERGSNRFLSDRSGEPSLSITALRILAKGAGQQLTFSCVPFGSGSRVALDRDLDGFLNRDEIAGGTDPADPSSHP